MARNRAGDATLNDPNPRELALENLALRQQLAALKHRRSRPRLTEMHRLFWTVLSKLWRDWRGALLIVNAAGGRRPGRPEVRQPPPGVQFSAARNV